MPRRGPRTLTAWVSVKCSGSTSPSRARQVVPAQFTSPRRGAAVSSDEPRTGSPARPLSGLAYVEGANVSRGRAVEADHRAAGMLDRCLHRGPDPEAAPVTTTVCPVRLVIGGRALASSGSRRRTGGSAGAAAATPTVLVRVPMPSTVRVTTSPGCSGGGSCWPRRPHSSARQPPLPTVPEPRTSPGRDDAVAGRVGDHGLEGPAHVGEQVAADLVAVHRDRAPEVEEAVGVAVRLELVGGDDPRPEGGARSPCPWPGPRPTCISRPWRSRADQSLKIV